MYISQDFGIPKPLKDEVNFEILIRKHFEINFLYWLFLERKENFQLILNYVKNLCKNFANSKRHDCTRKFRRKRCKTLRAYMVHALFLTFQISKAIDMLIFLADYVLITLGIWCVRTSTITLSDQ